MDGIRKAALAALKPLYAHETATVTECPTDRRSLPETTMPRLNTVKVSLNYGVGTVQRYTIPQKRFERQGCHGKDLVQASPSCRPIKNSTPVAQGRATCKRDALSRRQDKLAERCSSACLRRLADGRCKASSQACPVAVTQFQRFARRKVGKQRAVIQARGNCSTS